MNAISLVIDRWHAGHAGCYGNAWIATPELDRLASEGHVFDQATIDSPDLRSLYRAYWLGLHAAAPQSLEAEPLSLPQRLRAAGVATVLLTDEPTVAELPWAADFDEIIRVDSPPAAEAADDLSETRFAELFAAAIDWLADAPRPFLLWMHAQGMSAPWDAPLEYRTRYAEDDAIQPYAKTAPPQRWLPPGHDPDEVLAIRWAYAGQVTLLDECLGGLLDELRSNRLLEDTLLTVLGARGFPLGEHGRVGTAEAENAQISAATEGPTSPRGQLYEELMHVPWLLRLPNDTGAPARHQALVQPADLGATIASALISPAAAQQPGCSRDGCCLLPVVRDEVETVRDRACCIGPDGERSLRTRGWRLRWYSADAADGKALTPPELFVKPDDRWEVNDVADRCPELIEPLQAAFAECQQWHRRSAAASLPPLAESLVIGPG